MSDIVKRSSGEPHELVEARPYEEVQKEEFTERERPFGWIQWKGTQVCMDVHCVCGHHGHIDDEFVYAIRCSKCGRTYIVDGHVVLREFAPGTLPKDYTCMKESGE